MELSPSPCSSLQCCADNRQHFWPKHLSNTQKPCLLTLSVITVKRPEQSFDHHKNVVSLTVRCSTNIMRNEWNSENRASEKKVQHCSGPPSIIVKVAWNNVNQLQKWYFVVAPPVLFNSKLTNYRGILMGLFYFVFCPVILRYRKYHCCRMWPKSGGGDQKSRRGDLLSTKLSNCTKNISSRIFISWSSITTYFFFSGCIS